MSLPKRFKNRAAKKGVLGIEQIPQIVISIGIAVFSLGLVALFVSSFQASVTGDTAADNNTTAILTAGLEGLSEFNNWWSLIVIASIFLILFAVLFIFARQARGAGAV